MIKRFSRLHITISFLLGSWFVGAVVSLQVRFSPNAGILLKPGKGILEVYNPNNKRWGTICYTYWARPTQTTSYNCKAACAQLGYFLGGRSYRLSEELALVVNPQQHAYPEIVLGGIECTQHTNLLNECPREPFGDRLCDADQAAGCECFVHQQHANQQTPINTVPKPANPQPAPGTCRGQYRITPLVAHRPKTGRVEVLEAGEWGLICNKKFTNNEATVLCRACGYQGTFTAPYLSGIQKLPPLRITQDGFNCNPDIHNSLLSCPKLNLPQSCQSIAEAATVDCGDGHETPPQVAFTVQVSGDATSIRGCLFRDPTAGLELAKLKLHSQCTNVDKESTPDKGVCLSTDGMRCTPSSVISVSQEEQQYCWTLVYDELSTISNMITGDIFSTDICLKVHKKGQASSLVFESIRNNPARIKNVVINRSNLPFTMTCYDNPSFTGPPLVAGRKLRVGQYMSCEVSVEHFNDDLILVVPKCYFVDQNTNGRIDWLTNKCPLVKTMDTQVMINGVHSMRYSFKTPQLHQAGSQMSIVCDTYVCDVNDDGQPYCDQRCLNPHYRRRRRSVNSGHGSINHVKMYGYSINTTDRGAYTATLASLSSLNITADDLRIKRHTYKGDPLVMLGRGLVKVGPLNIQNNRYPSRSTSKGVVLHMMHLSHSSVVDRVYNFFTFISSWMILHLYVILTIVKYDLADYIINVLFDI